MNDEQEPEDDDFFTGNYQDQYDHERAKSEKFINGAMSSILSQFLNGIAVQVLNLELPDDPIERIKAKARKNSMRDVLADYSIGASAFGINLVDNSVPPDRIQKMLAKYAKEHAGNN